MNSFDGVGSADDVVQANLAKPGFGCSHYCRRKIASMHQQVRIDGRRMILKRSIRESAAPEFYKMRIMTVKEHQQDPGQHSAAMKIEKVKATRVFAKEKSIVDPGYCKDLQFRDPGGSMSCP